MPRRLKFRIGAAVCRARRWQIRPLVIVEVCPGYLGVGNSVGKSAMHADQRLGHAVSCQRADVGGLRLLQEFGNVGGRNGVAVKPRFDALQPEGGQHQQPRDEYDEQRRHKQVVNTAKVSVGSRIVTGPQYQLSAVSVRLQP
jgi:hypothetical protein